MVSKHEKYCQWDTAWGPGNTPAYSVWVFVGVAAGCAQLRLYLRFSLDDCCGSVQLAGTARDQCHEQLVTGHEDWAVAWRKDTVRTFQPLWGHGACAVLCPLTSPFTCLADWGTISHLSGWADFRYSPARNPADLIRIWEIQVPSPLFLGGLAVG